jgi:hypothetical protein
MTKRTSYGLVIIQQVTGQPGDGRGKDPRYETGRGNLKYRLLDGIKSAFAVGL